MRMSVVTSNIRSCCEIVRCAISFALFLADAKTKTPEAAAINSTDNITSKDVGKSFAIRPARLLAVVRF